MDGVPLQNDLTDEVKEMVTQQSKDVFDLWASKYEQQVLEEQGYTAPFITAKSLHKLITSSSLDASSLKVLDAGSGTGLVGVHLANFGFTNLIAADISPNMLEECKKKNIYREFHEIILGQTLPFKDDEFDVVVCVGVFQSSGAPSSSLLDFLRITKPGGFIIFTLVSYVPYRNILTGRDEEVGFQTLQTKLEEEGKWKLIEVSSEMLVAPKQDPDTAYRIWIYKVTK